MARKTRFGIILIVCAVLFAVFNISRMVKHTEEESRTIKVTTSETTAPESTEVQTQELTETVTEEETITITINIYSDEHSEMKAFDVRLPDDEILSLVNNDKEGLNTKVQEFVNGYGYRDAMYAAYAGDVEINSYDNTVTLTYFLKYKRKKAIYFYLI